MATRKPVKKHTAQLRTSPVKHKVLLPKEEAKPSKPKLPLIPHQDNELMLAIASSVDLLSELESRLRPVLTPDDFESVKGESSSTGVPLADSLIGKTSTMEAINAKLNNLLERLAI